MDEEARTALDGFAVAVKESIWDMTDTIKAIVKTIEALDKRIEALERGKHAIDPESRSLKSPAR